MTNEMIFFRNLSYEFGKDVQRLETENAELKKELAFHKGQADFYRMKFHQNINNVPTELKKHRLQSARKINTQSHYSMEEF